MVLIIHFNCKRVIFSFENGKLTTSKDIDSQTQIQLAVYNYSYKLQTARVENFLHSLKRELELNDDEIIIESSIQGISVIQVSNIKGIY